MSIFVLKLLALIAMILDHITEVLGWGGWNILPINATYLRYIGRISYPIFAFCIVNGWTHSRDRKKYFLRICLCAIVSQIPYSLALYTPNHQPIGIGKGFYFHFMPIFFCVALLCTLTYWYFILNQKCDASIWIILFTGSLPAILLDVSHIWILSDSLNVLYTLALGMMVLYVIDVYRLKIHWWEKGWLTAICALTLLAYGSRADYGIRLMGVILIVALYLTREYQVIQSAVVLLWGCLLYGIIIGNWTNALATAIPAAFVLLYNSKGKRIGKVPQYLFYGFYPIHLLLIGVINIYFRLC